MVSYQDVAQAGARALKIVSKTPVFTNTTVNQLTGSKVFLKCENFQRTGSFKFRGVYNALAQLSPEEKQAGVLTYSSGNHGQALALASQLLGIKATVIMPEDAPAVKIAANKGYGAEVILYNRQNWRREELATKIAGERGAVIIPPYDHPHIIAGQGTAAKELIEEVGELDILLISCGGGGLLSGCAIASKTLSPQCRVIGVEPELGDDATRSFYSQSLQTVSNPNTIADGARTPSLGEITFPLVLQYVDDMVTVSDTAIVSTMYFIWERLKIVVEPTGVLGATALLEGIVNGKGKKVGVIITGGNVDLKQIGQLFV